MTRARKPYAVYVITKHGVGIAARLTPNLPGAEVFVSQKLHADLPGAVPLREASA